MHIYYCSNMNVYPGNAYYTDIDLIIYDLSVLHNYFLEIIIFFLMFESIYLLLKNDNP